VLELKRFRCTGLYQYLDNSVARVQEWMSMDDSQDFRSLWFRWAAVEMSFRIWCSFRDTNAALAAAQSDARLNELISRPLNIGFDQVVELLRSSKTSEVIQSNIVYMWICVLHFTSTLEHSPFLWIVGALISMPGQQLHCRTSIGARQSVSGWPCLLCWLSLNLRL
jgi:hypothetical protein